MPFKYIEKFGNRKDDKHQYRTFQGKLKKREVFPGSICRYPKLLVSDSENFMEFSSFYFFGREKCNSEEETPTRPTRTPE